MSLEAILEAAEATGLEQVEEIRVRVEKEAEEILELAQKDAKAIKEEERQNKLRSANRKRAELLHQANLQQLQLQEEAREQFIKEHLKRTRRQLQNFRDEPDYPGALRRFIEEALDAFSSSMIENETPLLEIDPRDREYIEQILPELVYELKVVEGGECWGGVIVTSQDGRVRVINTLEARLDRAIPSLRASLRASLSARLSKPSETGL